MYGGSSLINILSLIASDAEQGKSCSVEDEDGVSGEDPGYAAEEKHWKEIEAESRDSVIGTASADPPSADV